MSRRTARLRDRGGFSLIELLVVVVVTTLGFVALFGMQTATLRGMANTRHILEATNLAENYLEQLRLELMAWTELNPLTNAAQFPHLANLPTGAAAAVGGQTPGGAVNNAPGWIIGDEDGGTDRRVAAVGDLHPFNFNAGIRGAMLTPGSEALEQPYCLHYRLTWLIPNRLLRAEVEVSWPLDTADMTRFLTCNELAANRLGELRSVTLNTTVSVNLFQR